MSRIAVLVVVAQLMSVLPAQAEGPIAKSAAKHATAAAQVNGRSSAIQRPGWFWGGLGMIAGGTVISALGATALRNESCVVLGGGFFLDVVCVEEVNQGLLWAGVGVASVGSMFMWMGTKADVQIGDRRVAYTVRF